MNFNIKRTLLACAAVAATAMLVGCVTSYQPWGTTGGYKDRQIDDQTLHVEFRGNGYRVIAAYDLDRRHVYQ